jgi:elongation factor Ts
MEVTSNMVKELREKTGAGMMDCKKALAEAQGNFDAAIDLLRKKGMKDVGKRADRVAAEGLVYSYIHAGGRIGVMVELNCETDFVARGQEFQDVARAIAMHVAWAAPKYLSREEVPTAVLDHEKEILTAQLKPEQQKMADKILVGQIDKYLKEVCLLEQLDVRDASAKKSIQDIVNELSARVGEKVILKRFARFEVGTSDGSKPSAE